MGTEEEVRIAGGSSDTGEALRKIRSLSGATIVLKTGAMGATVFGGEISDDLESGLRIPGYPVDVFNSTGAGDAFMSGFLRRWLDDEPLESCGELANACGALVVSRGTGLRLPAGLHRGRIARRNRELWRWGHGIGT